ncbi:MAG: diguanylate cyclase domain-containing protein [Selenomonas sp.]
MGRMMEMGPAFEQVAEIFFYDLPYVFALPVSFLLLAILLVYVSRDTALRGIYCAIIQFLVTFMLWITMNSHIIHAVLKDWAEWGWLALLFLYLVPISANYVVYAALEQERRRGVFWVIGLYGLCFALATAGEALGWRGYGAMLTVYYGLLPPLEIYTFWQLWQSARQGNRRSRALLLPLVLLTVLGVFDGCNLAFGFTAVPTFFMPLGVFSFFVVVLQLQQEQLLREHQLEDQTVHLQYQAALARERAELDVLTGCRNRMSFEMALREGITDVRQTGRPLACLMFDIDHFKRYNDTFGHEAGDMVLKEFSAVVRQMLDKTKPFFRWGGEEFVILCAGLDLDEAAVFGNMVRRSVAEHVNVSGQQVTVSVGVSIWHGAFDTAEHLFHRADEALYAAKDAGRNCLRVEEPAGEAGVEL